MRASVLTLSIAGLLFMGTASMRAALTYPLVVTLDAQVKSGVTTIASKVTVRVERAMLTSWRTQVTDALQHGGYSNFVSKLRPLSRSAPSRRSRPRWISGTSARNRMARALGSS